MARGLTLIELLLVIAVIAIVAAAVSIGFGSTAQEAEETVVAAEMCNICAAFQRFYADCRPTAERLEEIRKYGLWPLTTAEHRENWGKAPAEKDPSKDYPLYDAANAAGWSGPYCFAEGHLCIDPDRTGQPESPGSGVKVPVMLDPSGRHYRVFAPQRAGAFALHKLFLSRLPAGRSEVEIQNAADALADDPEMLEKLRQRFPDCAFAWLLPGRAMR
ncbi:MAG: prepilin-type N-terminal cleavage/methylation domain-containing protein [Planctomycetota bacterium]|nr:prepilin-type N-terminal cleavage/methylation domain-containing protein [Planctomycetota bacterium]